MADISIFLPTELQRYIDLRVTAGGFADPADFLCMLVQRDRDAYQTDVVRVRGLIQEGIDSGVVDMEPEAILDRIIAEDLALRD